MKAKATQVIQVAAKFGRDDIRIIRFSKTGSVVEASVDGWPTLTIKPEGKGFTATGPFTRRTTWISYETRTAEAAYRKGVRALWRDHDDGIKI